MAIIFDPIEKVIQLDTFAVSEKELWSAFVDWSVLSDNLKYGAGMTQLGGFEPIALYIYLELGWKIRPKEADGITTISGNVLVQGGGSPIVPTIGNWQTLVNMETPVKATTIEVNTGSGVTEQDKLDIADRVWDESISEHLSNDSTGLTLNKVTSISSSLDDMTTSLEMSDEKIREIWELHGLDINKPLTVTQSKRLFGSVDQKIQTTGSGSTQETKITRN